MVRRIFEWSAEGWGITRIAKQLNAEGISPPRGGEHGWAPSAVREMLYNELYRAGEFSGIAPGRLTGGERRRRRYGRRRIASRLNWPTAGSSRTTFGMLRTPRSLAGRGSSCLRSVPRVRPSPFRS